MAKYTTKGIYEESKKVAEENNFFFIEDIIAMISCSKPTFYEYIKVDSNEFNVLKGLLNKNKIATKSSIRAKLHKGKGNELIALYKLIATDEERRSLSMTHIETIDKSEVPRQYIIIPAKPQDEE